MWLYAILQYIHKDLVVCTPKWNPSLEQSTNTAIIEKSYMQIIILLKILIKIINNDCGNWLFAV